MSTVGMHFLLIILSCNYCLADSGQSEKIQGNEDIYCPSTNFFEFYDAFMENEEIQRRFTKVPLEHLFLKEDASVDDSVPVIHMLKKDEIRFPVTYNKAEMNRVCVYMHVNEYSPRRAVVINKGLDSGIRTELIFINYGCWVLVGLENWSM
ncbi:MAG: hypothetical protein HQL56_02500 [Magnetococcales bacterium]|nr:hypothetical protein [Magnetococcales bacterium]